MQIVFVVPYSDIDGGFIRSNPVYNLVLPIAGGAVQEKIGPFDLPTEPEYPQALGDSLMYSGDPYPLSGIPTYFDGLTEGLVVPSMLGGTIMMMFPLGEEDWLVANRFRIGRITAGAVAWSYPTVNVSGDTDCIACGLVLRGGNYYLFMKSKYNDPYDTSAKAYYSQIDITGATDPGIFSTWASVDIVPDVGSLTGLFGYEAILSVYPDFEYAMVGNPFTSGDGVSLYWRAVLEGPAIDVVGGKEVTGHGIGETFVGGFSNFMGSFVLTTTVVSGDITDAVRAYGPITYSADDLQALADPGTAPEVSGGTAFLYLGDPPPVPAFWKNLRRAVEII